MKRLLLIGVTVMNLIALLPSTSNAAASDHQGPERADKEICDVGSGWRCGYVQIPARDSSPGVMLSYWVRLPTQSVDGLAVEAEGPMPTVLWYTGYGAGYKPNLSGLSSTLSKHGYAIMNVTVRGTGCSGGTYDPFHPREALDAKYVIDEWIPQQSWSNGQVAMVGESYSAITIPPVAATRPEHLEAIVPIFPVGDLYRDVSFPGGIFNNALVAIVPTQNAFSAAAASSFTRGELTEGHFPGCVERVAERAPTFGRPAIDARSHEYDSDFWRGRSAWDDTDEIDIPTLLIGAWQDNVVGGRAIASLSGIDKLHAILTNGDHVTLPITRSKTTHDEVASFLNHYLLGVGEGYENKPRIQIWWETGSDADSAPRWVTGLPRWPAPQTQPKDYFLSGNGTVPGDGTLEEAPGSVSGGPDPYAYVPGSGQNNLHGGLLKLVGGNSSASTWSVPPRPGMSLTYTTPPLTKAVTAVGSASLDLWLASTAIDTDLQVTLSEIRDYGANGGLQEVYVQQGWLRASHRAEDEILSSETMPFHTHESDDVALLTPGQPTPMRVEIFPFGHVFRAGSRIRITIEAPKALADLWSLEPLSIPGVNSLYHDRDHPSKLVLSMIPGTPDEMPRDYPACGAVLAQPCRATSL